VPRAYVRLAASPSDLQTWKAMDKTALDLAQALAGSPDRIQYLYDNAWRTEPFPLDRPFPEWHRGLGSTYHESGTLWMGDNQEIVTNSVGRLSSHLQCLRLRPVDLPHCRLGQPCPDRSDSGLPPGRPPAALEQNCIPGILPAAW
jgi:hypothetical protein